MALVKYNDRSLKDLTTAPAAAGGDTGAVVLIKTLTASSSANLQFLNGSDGVVFDNTYPIYKFEFINMHPALDDKDFGFQVDVGTGTSYAQTITSTSFLAEHTEGGSSGSVAYNTSRDQAQGTANQIIASGVGNDNDQACSGELTIYSPSSTTFVKHFMSTSNVAHNNQFTQNWFIAGYINTTTALTRVQFKFNSGNIDVGTIKMYGILDS